MGKELWNDEKLETLMPIGQIIFLSNSKKFLYKKEMMAKRVTKRMKIFSRSNHICAQGIKDA